MTDRITVLVVDDESYIRTFVQDVLRRSGYAVLTAASAEQALTIFNDHRSHIRCLITDCKMPGMSGLELAGLLVGQWPGLKVVFMSGSEAGSEGYPLLRKPFSAAQLAKLAREVLGVTNQRKKSTDRPRIFANNWQQPCEPIGNRLGRTDVNALTPREGEILLLLAQGYSTRNVAHKLGIAFKTVVCHRSHIYHKLDVHGIVELVRYAIRHGMIEA